MNIGPVPLLIEQHLRQGNSKVYCLRGALFHATIAMKAKLGIGYDGRLGGLRRKVHVFRAHVHTETTFYALVFIYTRRHIVSLYSTFLHAITGAHVAPSSSEAAGATPSRTPCVL
jgi:hypothetical protein